ncbi:class I SAM-dependent methyltransferase [Pseudomonas aeruginosa]|uniref:class I SAM-dependent methyltransferase n=1 Tax=Pseudomonas aeruginosa TaxID=287 RepID=UPI0017855CCB|nr:class I SAM-dependent methyltransferase [Pseudomonas aeruginosa]MBG5292083.1 class I SAM-dependent methyltransferase [Pseudomonas aeruginosa]
MNAIIEQARSLDGYQDSSELLQRRDQDWVLDRAGIEPRSLLDLGCGIGSLLLGGARRWPGLQRLWGIERSPLRLEQARAQLRGAGVEARLLEGDLLDLPPLAERFELISMTAVLHWLYPDEERLFRWVARHLEAQGGIPVHLAPSVRRGWPRRRGRPGRPGPGRDGPGCAGTGGGALRGSRAAADGHPHPWPGGVARTRRTTLPGRLHRLPPGGPACRRLRRIPAFPRRHLRHLFRTAGAGDAPGGILRPPRADRRAAHAGRRTGQRNPGQCLALPGSGGRGITLCAIGLPRG